MTQQLWFPEERLTEADRQLDEFAALPEGWKYGEGGPIDEALLQSTRRFIRHLALNGFRKIRAFAGADRSVMLNAVHDGHLVEMLFEADGAISVVHEEGSVERDRIERASWAEARAALARAVRSIWPSYNSSIQGTTTRTFSASRHMPTKIYKEACQSS